MVLSAGERQAGHRAVPIPSPETTAILRRIAAGWMSVTLTDKGPEYRYDDGRLIRAPNGRPLSPTAFHRMLKEHWLLPIDGGSFLEDGPPQQYRARTPADGKLPRIR